MIEKKDIHDNPKTDQYTEMPGKIFRYYLPNHI